MSAQKAIQGLDQWATECRIGLERGMEETVGYLASRVKAEHKFRNRTGETERSIGSGIHLSNRDRIVGVVTVGVPYAVHIEYKGKGSKSKTPPVDVLAEGAIRGDWAFLATSIDEHRNEILPMIVRSMKI